MTTIESIDNLLTMAARLLDDAVKEMRDLPLEPVSENIERIGRALVYIFEIQHQIYADRPDLQPEFLKDPGPHPEADRRLTKALAEALRRKKSGDVLGATALLSEYLAIEPSEFHRRCAQAELDRWR